MRPTRAIPPRMTLSLACRSFGPIVLAFAGGCAHVRVALSDRPCVETRHSCISLNPDVTQESATQTICVPGYAKSVRPASAYTQGVKAKLLREAGLDKSRMPDFELDHIVPLALGGHPRKLANLRLQPWEGEHGAKRKDALENRLHNLVCRRELTLGEAQSCIAEDWEACAAKYL